MLLPANVIALANSARRSPDDLGDVVALPNELLLDNDGWALLAPFGEHRKTRTVLTATGQPAEEHFVQVVDDTAVDAVIANEQGEGLFARIKRALIKRPIYNGHPDLQLYSPQTVAPEAPLVPLGLNDGCRKTARGLEFKPLLVPEGARAVEAGSKYPSALFLLQRTGVTRPNGDIEVRPFKLASIGLTPHPNISGVDSLANAKPNTPAASGIPNPETTQPPNDNMKQLLIGWLAAQGIALANDATDQTVFDALTKEWTAQNTKATALGNDKELLDQGVKQLAGERDAQKKRADDAALALANEQTALKAERAARCAAVVDLTIAQGKLDVAGRDAKLTELLALANDKLDAALADLAKLPPKFKTVSNLGDRKAEAMPTTVQVALANEIDALVKSAKLTKGQALNQVIKEKPEIYRAYIEAGCGAI